MISARSQGLPAIALPGDDAWEPEWARLLVGRYVSVVLECDRAGRQAAGRIAGDPKSAGVRGSVVDLAPGRQDGYDLTDWLGLLARAWVRASRAGRWGRSAQRRAPVCRRLIDEARRLCGDLAPFAVPCCGSSARPVVRTRGRASEDRADGAVRDLGGGGDLAV